MMNFDWQKFFQPSYLFSSRIPPFSFLFRYVLLVLFLLYLVLGVISLILSRTMKKKKPYYLKPLRKFYTYFFTLGSTGLILFFFRQERVYLFNLRFWLLLWFVVGLVWLFFIIRYLILDLPDEKRRMRELEVYRRYLPKKKK